MQIKMYRGGNVEWIFHKCGIYEFYYFKFTLLYFLKELHTWKLQNSEWSLQNVYTFFRIYNIVITKFII